MPQKLKDLRHNPKNPRKITEPKLEALKRSIEKFGDLSGFVYNHRSEQLVGGHQRTKSLPAEAEIVVEKIYDQPTKVGTTAVGYVEVDGERYPYREVDWDKKTETEANLAANQHGGEFDTAIFQELLDEMPDLDLELAGFDELDLNNLGLGLPGSENAEPDESEDGNPGSEKHFLEVECSSKSEMLEVYNDLISRGLIVRQRING